MSPLFLSGKTNSLHLSNKNIDFKRENIELNTRLQQNVIIWRCFGPSGNQVCDLRTVRAEVAIISFPWFWDSNLGRSLSEFALGKDFFTLYVGGFEVQKVLPAQPALDSSEFLYSFGSGDVPYPLQPSGQSSELADDWNVGVFRSLLAIDVPQGIKQRVDVVGQGGRRQIVLLMQRDGQKDVGWKWRSFSLTWVEKRMAPSARNRIKKWILEYVGIITHSQEIQVLFQQILAQ